MKDFWYCFNCLHKNVRASYSHCEKCHKPVRENFWNIPEWVMEVLKKDTK